MSNKFKWASEYKEGDGDVLLKAYKGDVIKRVDEENRTVEFIISTADVDRDGDTIEVAGWDLKSFKKNPVVLFGHDHGGLPIAKAPKVKIEDGKLVSGPTQFPEKGAFPFADTVFEMIKQGFLNSVSAGFIAKDSHMNEERGGVDFLKQELIEFSVVPVPSNPNALVQARSKGIDTAPLAEFYKATLDDWQENKLFMPTSRNQFEKYYKAANGKSKTISIPDIKKIAEVVKKQIDTEEKTVITFNSAHSDGTPRADRNESWDGPAQVAAADVDNLLVMATWREDKSRDELNKGDFKLPHHKAGGQNAVVFRGVVAATAALLGARGGVDIPPNQRRGVFNHLAKHYREFDEEPPEFRHCEEQILKDERLGLNEHGQICIKNKADILTQYDSLILELKQTNKKLTEMVNIAEELTDRVNRAILKQVPNGAVSNKPKLNTDAIAKMAEESAKKVLAQPK